MLKDEFARFRAEAQAAAESRIAAVAAEEAAQSAPPKAQVSPDPVDRFDQGKVFIERQEWANAELALTFFIANNPDDPRIKEARYWLGLAYLEQGQAGQAASIFIALFETGPPRGLGAENLFAMARALRELGNVDLAQVCSVYNEIEIGYGTELPEASREELLDLRLASECGQ